MKKYIWINIILLASTIWSCGSRKVESQKEVIKETTSEQSTNETKGSTTSELSEKTLFNLFESNMNFGIKPVGDVPAKFVFIHNGQKIEGETTGELNFSNQQKTMNKVTEIVHKIATTYQTKTTYKTHNTYKSVSKQKKSESKRSEFAWYILSAFLGMVLIIAVQVLWKKFGGGIVDRFNNGKIKF